MKRLFLIDWINARHHRPFWGILGLYFFILLMIIFNIAFKLQSVGELSNMGGAASEPSPYSAAWEYVGYIFKFLSFMPGIVIITHIGTDYSNNTFRQHIVNGLSRQEYFYAKGIFILAIALFFGLISYLLIILSGTLAGLNLIRLAAAGLPFLLGYVLSTAGMLLLAMYFGLIFRNTGMAIAAFVSYLILEMIIYGVILMNFSSLIGSDNAGVGRFLYQIDQFFPRGSFASLFPAPDDIRRGFVKASSVDGMYQTLAWVSALVWAGILYMLNLTLIRRKDL